MFFTVKLWKSVWFILSVIPYYSYRLVTAIAILKLDSIFSLPELQHTYARELKDTRAEEKGKVTLECETRRPAKRVTWLKGMVELRSGRKYVMRQKGVVLSLTITCLEKSDMDIYTCDVGTMQSRAQLIVQGEGNTGHYITVVQGCSVRLR